MGNKTGPKPKPKRDDESPWMIKPFPDELRKRLKDAAHDHRMTLREYVIQTLNASLIPPTQ